VAATVPEPCCAAVWLRNFTTDPEDRKLTAVVAVSTAAAQKMIGGVWLLALIAAPPAFVHPGLLHTEADLARMRAKVAAGEQPWLAGWEALRASRQAQLDWQPRPTAVVIRGDVPGQNVAVLFNDVHAAYQLALRWAVGGEAAYADRAVALMNGWSATLQEVGGNADRFLAAGIYGYQWANAAELLRTYPGWAPADLARFQDMMLRVFYPMNHDFLVRHNGAAITNYWANWDLCNVAAMQAIGVLCDRRDVYDEALTYFRTGGGNGAIDKIVYYVHPGHLGQWQEAGRDQGHTTLGIALAGPIFETAWNQGEDLYGWGNNLFLAGAEYVAKYNLGHDVPYQPYAWGLGQRGDRREQNEIAAAGRGSLRSGYELVINHYVNRRGIAAPYSTAYAAKLRPERGGGGHAATFDQVGLGTLTHTREPEAAATGPSGLTARKSGRDVVLSWWGASGATSYRVQRSAAAGGPETTLAADVRDPLTYTDRVLPPAAYRYVVTALREGQATGPPGEVRVDTVTRLLLTWPPTGDDVALHGGAAWTDGTLVLDGQDGYAALPPGIVSALSDFSIAAWVKLEAEQTWARLFDFGDDRGHAMFLTPRSNSGQARFAVSTVYGYNTQAIDADAALPIGRWVHLAVTLSGQAGTLYVDGVAVGRNEAIAFPPCRLGRTTENWLGRSRVASDPYLRGQLADFRLWDGAVSDAQIRELARRGQP